MASASFDLSELLFNVDSGFLEGLARGLKNGILKEEDYRHLTQCDTLDGKLKCAIRIIN